MSEQSNAVMLPKDVRPVLYDLTLTPDLDSFTFAGEETVDIEVLEATSSVTLNSAEIEVASCRVTTADGAELTPADISFDEQAETVTFDFGRPLPAGPAKLHIEFSGVLNDLLRGFYRSRYVDEDGGERHLATTQFEATDARRAFPCWDEPALKAKFRLSLVVPSDLAAVSNTLPVSESDLPGGLRRVTFGDTPVMSTYLLAFVVGDLRSIERPAPCGTLVRVWATPGKERQGRFALDLSVKLLDYFNGYFGVPYPLEKLDHIAIPDFAAGAMENWGAITYRENALLVDPEQSSAVTRQNVAGIVAHEMAHMWFGDLVTMAWWNDLWLNEAFASWMGDKSVDFAFPEWDVWTQFVSFDTNAGLGLDGLRSSHPIEQPVDNPSEIGQLFDAISYSKGGAILRMLEQFLGPDVFRQGIAHYIAKHQYDNARTEDLWDALGEASGQPVREMMNSWVLQTGYPVVEIETRRRRDGVEVLASQRRFFYENITGAADGGDETRWHVPLSVKTFVTGTTSVLMDGGSTALDVALPSVSPRGDWIMVNPDRTGFYRTNYSEDEWARLKRGVERLSLSAADRLGLQDDAYALAKAGYLPAAQFLSLAEAYVDEPDAPVWQDLSANLGGMERLLADEEFLPDYSALCRRIFRRAAAKAGWHAKPGEGHLDAMFRSTALNGLGGYGDDATLDRAVELFDDIRGGGEVDPNIRSVVMNLAAERGGRQTYDALWKMHGEATMEEQRARLLVALSHIGASELLRETLDRSLTDEVRVHNTVRVIANVASNRQGRDLAWEFVKTNWEELDRRYGEGGFALMELVSVAGRFTTGERLDDVRAFFDEHPVPGADRSVRQALERIELNVAFLARNRDGLAAWFAG